MPNGNQRGNNASRRARKAWLFQTFGNDGIVTCHFCDVPMLPEDCTIDRIIPGCRGGTYRRDNIRPSCRPCAASQGGRISASLRC